MERLFAGLSQKPYSPLTASFIQYASVHQGNFIGPKFSKLRSLLEDFVVRNWGDIMVIDYGDHNTWSTLLRTSARFRKRLLEGAMGTLKERCEELLVLEEYSLPEV
jgi:hypothetical protein